MASSGPSAAAGVATPGLPSESLLEAQKEAASRDAAKSETLPSPETLKKIYACDVLDKNGKAIKFGSLVQNTERRRNLIVFIRHFFCGYCQEYIRALARDLAPEELAALDIPTELTIIGCGDPSLMAGYVAETSCPYPIYADPSRQIYKALGLVVSLAAAKKKPDYISVSFWSSTLAGIVQGLKAGTGALKSGKISQNGGELVWLDGECTFMHTMKDTTSHVEIQDLEEILKNQS